MIRLFLAGIFLANVSIVQAQDQPRTFRVRPADAPTVFRPVDSTRNLLTTESRLFWAQVMAGYQCVEAVNSTILGNSASVPVRMARLSLFGTTTRRDPTDTVLTTIMPWLAARTRPYPAGGSALGLAP